MLRPFAQPVAFCCAKSQTGQTFGQTTPKRNNFGSVCTALSKTLPTFLGPRTCMTHGLLGGYCILSTMHTAALNNVGSCCIRLHTTANTDATIPNIVGRTILGVVASVCTPLPTRTQQFPTLLAEQSWELLRPFASSLTHRTYLVSP